MWLRGRGGGAGAVSDGRRSGGGNERAQRTKWWLGVGGAPFFGAFDSIGAGRLSFSRCSEEGDLEFVKATEGGERGGGGGVAPHSRKRRFPSREKRRARAIPIGGGLGCCKYLVCVCPRACLGGSARREAAALVSRGDGVGALDFRSPCARAARDGGKGKRARGTLLRREEQAGVLSESRSERRRTL